MKLGTLNITLRLKAFHPYYLNNFIIASRVEVQQFKNYQINHVFLPQTYEKFTVLKSPHVDKKARDQFERKTYNRLIKMKILNFDLKNDEILRSLILFFQNISIGVEINVNYTIDTYIPFLDKSKKVSINQLLAKVNLYSKLFSEKRSLVK